MGGGVRVLSAQVMRQLESPPPPRPAYAETGGQQTREARSIMRILMLPLAGLGLVALSTAAEAASPAYCALYAREYANQMVQEGAAPGITVSVQDQAYYRCLNRDEEPAMPTASAYFGADVSGAPALLGTISEGDVSLDDEEPAVSAPRPAATASATQTAVGSRSRRVPWTPEWVAWCSSHFPNSFDLKTGTVIPYQSNRREFCD